MKCPTCHSLMTKGEMSLENSLVDLLAGGGWYSELRFREPEQKPVAILTQSDSRPGLACKTCGHFLIIGRVEYTDTECMVCHTLMLAGATSCPKCGWTYVSKE
jgi:hypothetical protein